MEDIKMFCDYIIIKILIAKYVIINTKWNLCMFIFGSYYKNKHFNFSNTMYSNDPRLANASTGTYLMRPMNIEPPVKRMMPGIPAYKNYSERLRLGLDCDEVYPGIIIGKCCTLNNALLCG